MFITTKAVLAAAMVLAVAVTASAATNNDKIANGRSGQHFQATTSSPRSAVNSNDPSVAGGGSIGYNENMRKDDW
jgi:opacity protein-like surface antigen